MAYASRGSGVRRPDRDDQLRTALVAGLLPDAVVRDKPLGTRRVRALRCYPESTVGHRTTFSGRNSRPLRDQSRALRRRRLLRAWPRDHGALDYTRNAAFVGRRAHRARIVRLLLQHRARCLRQVAARPMAFDCLRGGHSRWLFWAIPLFADRGRVGGQNWLAGNAPDFCGRYAADFAAVSGPRDACNRDGIIGGSKANAVSATGIRGSIRPSQLCLARARFLHLRFSACVHYGALALLSDRPWPIGGGRWLDARRDRNFQYRRLVEFRWLSNRVPKRYLLSFIYFTRAAAIVAFITLPASPLATLVFGAVTGLMWLSTVPPTSALVAVMFGTRWLAMLFGFAFFSHQVCGFL